MAQPYPFPPGYKLPIGTTKVMTLMKDYVLPQPPPNNEPNEVIDGPEPAQLAIAEVCDEIKELLLEKNRAYGNSALDPVRIFSKASTIEQINVRIDDKLSRLVRGQAAGEDVEFDLIGYLVLKRVWRKLNSEGGER